MILGSVQLEEFISVLSFGDGFAPVLYSQGNVIFKQGDVINMGNRTSSYETARSEALKKATAENKPYIGLAEFESRIKNAMEEKDKKKEREKEKEKQTTLDFVELIKKVVAPANGSPFKLRHAFDSAFLYREKDRDQFVEALLDIFNGTDLILKKTVKRECLEGNLQRPLARLDKGRYTTFFQLLFEKKHQERKTEEQKEKEYDFIKLIQQVICDRVLFGDDSPAEKQRAIADRELNEALLVESPNNKIRFIRTILNVREGDWYWSDPVIRSCKQGNLHFILRRLDEQQYEAIVRFFEIFYKMIYVYDPEAPYDFFDLITRAVSYVDEKTRFDAQRVLFKSFLKSPDNKKAFAQTLLSIMKTNDANLKNAVLRSGLEGALYIPLLLLEQEDYEAVVPFLQEWKRK